MAYKLKKKKGKEDHKKEALRSLKKIATYKQPKGALGFGDEIARREFIHHYKRMAKKEQKQFDTDPKIKRIYKKAKKVLYG